MDESAEDAWSAVAPEWAELWGDFADPVRRAINRITGIRAGTRVLDVGCGSGEFLVALDRTGAIPAGIDLAPAMVELSLARVPGADVRTGSVVSLPWPDASFDVVTAINSLQFADDLEAAVAEMARVTTSDGFVAVANWADSGHNDLHRIEQAVASSFDEELTPDDDLRLPGGLERLVLAAGLEPVDAGVVAAPWEAPDEATLVRGILLGEDDDGLANGNATVVGAARPFRMPSGGYRLENAFRYVVARNPPSPG